MSRPRGHGCQAHWSTVHRVSGRDDTHDRNPRRQSAPNFAYHPPRTMELPFEYDPDWLEATFVSRVALDQGQALIRLPLEASQSVARIFTSLAAADINIDVITQTGHGDEATLAFTLAAPDRPLALRLLEDHSLRCYTHAPIAKLSLEGVGAGVQSEAAATLFDTLASSGINVQLISTSARIIAVVIALDQAERAFAAACRAFDFPDEEND